MSTNNDVSVDDFPAPAFFMKDYAKAYERYPTAPKDLMEYWRRHIFEKLLKNESKSNYSKVTKSVDDNQSFIFLFHLLSIDKNETTVLISLLDIKSVFPALIVGIPFASRSC